MKLHLSQHLTIGNKYTISVPGETESYFAVCDEYGCCEWLPASNSCYFALTDQAKKCFKGKTKIENGITLGQLFA